MTNNKDELISLFERYLSGGMFPEEKKGFEHRLEEDAPFRKEFEKYQILALGVELDAQAKMREEWAELGQKMDKEIRRNRRYNIIHTTLSVLVLIGIILLIYFWYKKTAAPTQVDSTSKNKSTHLILQADKTNFQSQSQTHPFLYYA